jgi:membrane protease subunit HflC
MKNVGTILAAAFLGLVLVLYMCTFKVRFTEVAIKKTWGQPGKDAITEPGLKFKWPSPIQSVVLYDRRTRTLEDRTEETRTVDGKNVVLTTFTLWRIADPSTFHTNFPAGEEDGERKLRTAIIAHKQAVVAQHGFDEFVSPDADRRKLREIEKEMERRVAADSKELGVEVVGFGIKKLALPQSVTSAIFDGMKSHEQVKASRYLAEGDARASDIHAQAKAVEARIMSAARRRVAEIENEAQKVVSAYYEEFKDNPELRIFLDKLRTVAEGLRKRTTLILDTQTSPYDVFEKSSRDQVRPGPRSAPDSQAAAAEKADD